MTLQPPSKVWSSASKATRRFNAAVSSLVPGAVLNNTVGCLATKFTGKISGLPDFVATRRPNATLASKLQLSSSLSTVIGSCSAITAHFQSACLLQADHHVYVAWSPYSRNQRKHSGDGPGPNWQEC